MSSGSNYDTATTLIGLVLASAFMIYLGGWLGAGGVAIFLFYAWFSPPQKKSFLGQVAEGAETGCGTIVLCIVVLLLARLCGCG